MLDEWALPYLNPRKLGAKMDGSTDDVPAATTCVAYLGGKPAALMIDQPMRLASAHTWPANVQLHFMGEGRFIYEAPLTLNGAFHAGPQQIFMPSGVSASLAGRPLIRGVYPEWFGAPVNGTDSDVAATQLAFQLAALVNYLPVCLLNRDYRWDAQVLGGGSTGQSFNGVGLHGIPGTRILCAGIPQVGPGTAALRYRGGSGQMSKIRVKDIEWQGDANTICVEFAGQGGAKAVRNRFGLSARGLRLHNQDVNSFTEYCTAEACQFDSNCAVGVEYLVTAGKDSFHGSGLTQRCRVNTNGGTVVRIGAGAKVYNAPLDVQVWATGAATLVQNDSTKPTLLEGKVTYEVTDPDTLVLGAGGSIPFAGPIVGTGEGVSAGTLFQVDAAVINSDSTITTLGGRKSYEALITTGANTLPSSFATRHRRVWLQFEMANYDYRFEGIVDHNGYGNPGKWTQTSNDLSVNGAGFGAPTFAVDTSGRLVATNAAWPASGVQCVYSEIPIAGGMLQDHHTQAL